MIQKLLIKNKWMKLKIHQQKINRKKKQMKLKNISINKFLEHHNNYFNKLKHKIK